MLGRSYSEFRQAMDLTSSIRMVLPESGGAMASDWQLMAYF